MTWVLSSFAINGQRVEVSVKRLDVAGAERAAAELAWFTYEAGAQAENLAPGWSVFLQRVLSDCVALTVDPDRMAALEGAWDDVVSGAFQAFVRTNDLQPAVLRYLQGLRDRTPDTFWTVDTPNALRQ
jgi:hypothetical protein